MTIDTKKLRERIATRVADLVGQQFGRLLVESRGENSRHDEAQWKCSCECGGSHVTTTNSLKSGKVQSCGCWQREHAKHRDTSEHGHARRSGKTRTYRAWRNMLLRCENPKASRYERYGGRGIAVCERWHSFEAFLADMGECHDGLTLDRFPDRDGNYAPGNCRWATRSEQEKNKSRADHCRRGHVYPSNVRIDAKGARVCRVCVADSARARRARSAA